MVLKDVKTNRERNLNWWQWSNVSRSYPIENLVEETDMPSYTPPSTLIYAQATYHLCTREEQRGFSLGNETTTARSHQQSQIRPIWLMIVTENKICMWNTAHRGIPNSRPRELVEETKRDSHSTSYSSRDEH